MDPGFGSLVFPRCGSIFVGSIFRIFYVTWLVHVNAVPVNAYRRSAWRQTTRAPRPAFVRANSKTQEDQSRRRSDGGRFFAPGSKGGLELRSCSGTSGERLDRSGFVFLDIPHALQVGC